MLVRIVAGVHVGNPEQTGSAAAVVAIETLDSLLKATANSESGNFP